MLIVSTIGPSIQEKGKLQEIFQKGCNGIRINCAHGDFEDFERIIKEVRNINDEVLIVQDLSGSKIRISSKLPYLIKLYNREEIIFCSEEVYKVKGYNSAFGSKKIIPLNITQDFLSKSVVKEISMKDDTMFFEIIDKSKIGIKARVIKGGVVRAGKGCNIKGLDRSTLPFLEKDKRDIKWGLENKVDIICQSFVECKEDILEIKGEISKLKIGHSPKLWAKVETPTGIENLKEIISEVEGVVLGRGDLIPESSIEYVPSLQEKAIKVSKEMDVPIIIGTHILNTMKFGRRAELSEVDSIYHLIKNGVSGFLLAGETSIGKAPIKTVAFLKKLIETYEGGMEDERR